MAHESKKPESFDALSPLNWLREQLPAGLPDLYNRWLKPGMETAEPHVRQILKQLDKNPKLARSRFSFYLHLGQLTLEDKDYDASLTCLRAVRLLSKRFGFQLPDTMNAMLAASYDGSGQTRRAETFYLEDYRQIRALPDNDPTKQLQLYERHLKLGLFYARTGQLDPVEYHVENAISLSETLFANLPQARCETLLTLATVYEHLGESFSAKTEQFWRDALALNPHDDLRARILRALAHFLEAHNRLNEAVPFLQEALALHQASEDHADPNLLYPLGRIAQHNGDTATARKHFEAALAVLQTSHRYNQSRLPVFLALGELYLADERWEEAEALLEEALEIMTIRQGETHPDTFKTYELLQTAQSHLSKPAEATVTLSDMTVEYPTHWYRGPV